MLIPATSVTNRHQIRMRVGGLDLGWLDVDHVTTPASPAGDVLFRCGPVTRFTVKADTMVDARLPLHTRRRPALTLTRVKDGNDRGADGTWQGNECVVYSIATYLGLPVHIHDDVDAAAEFLERFFEWLATTARSEGYDLSFEVEVGPDTDAVE